VSTAEAFEALEVSSGRRGRRPLAVVGRLSDGTPHFAPVGVVVAEGDHVLCHLCGEWFRSVLAHLRQHGWDQARYRAAFGLERAQSLEGAATRRRRAAVFIQRRQREPAVRAGCEVGRRWVASGDLTRAASRATTRARLTARGAAIAARFGFPDLDSYLADRRAAGQSW
jgi:ROS/MUCR transcriptional regulator protein